MATEDKKPSMIVFIDSETVSSQLFAELYDVLTVSFMVSFIDTGKDFVFPDSSSYFLSLSAANETMVDGLFSAAADFGSNVILQGAGLLFRRDIISPKSDLAEKWEHLTGLRVNNSDSDIGDLHEAKIRVFPHFLTHGLDEWEKDYIFPNTCETIRSFDVSDNVFLRSEQSEALSCERVFGQKGHVILIKIAFGNTGHLSKLERCIYGNLNKLEHNDQTIEKAFGPFMNLSLPSFSLRQETDFENVREICCWNTLYAKDSKDLIYSHSSIFLPYSVQRYAKAVSQFSNGDPFDNVQLVSVEIRNTDFCNQDCFFCFNRKSMSLDYDRQVISSEAHHALERSLFRLAVRYGNFGIRYSGAGEPVLHPETITSIKKFGSAGFPVTLISNGALFSVEEAETVAANAAYVRFSIDACNPETYAKIRRTRKQDFDKMIRNLRIVCESPTLCGVTFLVNRLNFKEIERFCLLMKSVGVNVVFIRSTNDPGVFTPSEMADIYSALDKVRQLNNDYFKVFSTQFRLYRGHTRLHYRFGERVPCWASRMKAVIQPNGDVIACLSRPDIRFGNINEQPFSDIWGGDGHMSFLRSREWENCSQCIESRFNNAMDFLYNHQHEEIIKVSRHQIL